MRALEKIRTLGGTPDDTLHYFLVKNSKFCLLPKIHNHLHNVPGRPVILSCGFYTENLPLFLDHYLQSIAQKVNSFIKDTDTFYTEFGSTSGRSHSLDY